MAEGAWVPAFDSLWDSQKTHRLAKELKVTTEVAAAKYLKLLKWARENAAEGEIGGADRRLIAHAVDLPERRGAEFYRALEVSRFISSDGQGRILGWQDGPGKLVESRDSDRLRKQHDRQKHSRPVDGCPKCRVLSNGQPPQSSTTGTAPSNPSGGRPADDFGLSGAEETRGEETRTPSPRASSGRAPTKGSLSTGHALTPEEQRRANEAKATEILESATGLWKSVLERVRAELAAGVFVTWFAGTRLEEHAGKYYVIGPNAFAIDWLQRQYLSLIRGTIGVIEQDIDVEVRIVDELFIATLENARESTA